jgi:hypothetical protein
MASSGFGFFWGAEVLVALDTGAVDFVGAALGVGVVVGGLEGAPEVC